MDEERQEELGLKPLLDKLTKFGGWPVLVSFCKIALFYWSHILT
jgi:hypothetical protein